jgi:glutamine amidotransferase
MAKVSIVDYDTGNIFSMVNAVRRLGHDAELVSTPEQIARAHYLILPGVGAFGDAMRKLGARGLVEPIRQLHAKGAPILGVCLGLQLFFESSEEDGAVAGLSLLPGTVRRFPNASGYKIPQIQWNMAAPTAESRVFSGLRSSDFYYFVHSYYVLPDRPRDIAATSEYCEMQYSSAVEVDNLTGVQFHPEKSADAGLKLLGNWLRAA